MVINSGPTYVALPICLRCPVLPAEILNLSGCRRRLALSILDRYDINRLLTTAAATTNGIGFAQMRRFFAMMNMPQPMNEKIWHHYKGQLHNCAMCTAVKHLQEAAR